MQLTLINFFKKTVPGHIFRGKRRLVKPVSKKAMDTLTREYERQEQVMLLLRNPYLTLVCILTFKNIIKYYILFLCRRNNHRVMPRNCRNATNWWPSGRLSKHCAR